MLRSVVVLLTTGILLVLAASVTKAGNQTVNACTCMLREVDSRLTVISEIVENTRRRLSDDLKGICAVGQCENKPTNCTECPRKEKPTNCTECPRQEKPTNCTECPCKEKPTDCSECPTNERVAKPIDCSDLYRNGKRKSEAYVIWPQSRISKHSVVVYCDMKDGGGWTVIQRRGDFGNDADFFDKGWELYKTRFGSVYEEHWIGNDNIFALTNRRSYQLKFDLTDWENNTKYAVYDDFWISDELSNYTLHFGAFKGGEAGNSLKIHNGMKFSTKDRDNDESSSNCAEMYKGGWWYKDCFEANLNGRYLKEKQEETGGVNWEKFNEYGTKYSLKDTVMKIRPMDF